MTETIINGVDVSGCEYYDTKMNGVCECKNTKEYGTPTRVTGCGGCKFNPNCYYKQLKRKEYQLEIICKKFGIEYTIDEESGEIYCHCNKLEHLKQERGELLDYVEELDEDVQILKEKLNTKQSKLSFLKLFSLFKRNK